MLKNEQTGVYYCVAGYTKGLILAFMVSSTSISSV